MRETNARNTYLMRETNARRPMRKLNESKVILELKSKNIYLQRWWEIAERLIEKPQMAMISAESVPPERDLPLVAVGGRGTEVGNC